MDIVEYEYPNVDKSHRDVRVFRSVADNGPIRREEICELLDCMSEGIVIASVRRLYRGYGIICSSEGFVVECSFEEWLGGQ